MSKSSPRPSLAERLAAVAGPQNAPLIMPEKIEPALKDQAPKTRARAKVVEIVPAPTKARIGKSMVAGYFSPQMAKAVKLLAVERDTTVQALIGEGLDMVLHKHGKHPMGER